MDIVFDNVPWMVWNLYLALVPVPLAWFLFQMPSRWSSVLLGLLWFMYLPNSIYVFTDLQHLVRQSMEVDLLGKVLLLMQYTLLESIGLICFLIAFYPIEYFLQVSHLSKRKTVAIIITINMLMGFAMVLGKTERVNSWDLFIAPHVVINSLLHVTTSFELASLAILLGLFTNFFYFLFRNWVVQFLGERFTKRRVQF